MGIIRRSSKEKRPRFDYKRWVDYERLVDGAQSIYSAVSMFTVKRKTIQPQSLEQVMERLHLSPKDIQDRKRSFLHMVVLMLTLTGCLIGYSIYMILHHHYSGAAVSTALSLVTLGMGFRYHFWYFQLNQGKLGCTLYEWFMIGVIGTKK